ncbi:hypothetical protein QTN25_000584 [Entamoeba marina]
MSEEEVSKDVVNLIKQLIQDNEKKSICTSFNSIKCYLQDNSLSKISFKKSVLEENEIFIHSTRSPPFFLQPTPNDQKLMIEKLNKALNGVSKDFIYNIEEIGYQLFERSYLALAPSKSCEFGRETKQSNLVGAICADGSKVSPLIIKKKRSKELVSDGLIISHSPDKYSTNLYYSKKEFGEWFQNNFIPDVSTKKNTKKYNGKIVLIIDEYFKDYLEDVKDSFSKINLEVIYLINHTSKQIQPFNEIINKIIGNNTSGQPTLKLLESYVIVKDYNSLTEDNIQKSFANFFNLVENTDSSDLRPSKKSKQTSNKRKTSSKAHNNSSSETLSDGDKLLENFIKTSFIEHSLIPIESIQCLIQENSHMTFSKNFTEVFPNYYLKVITPTDFQSFISTSKTKKLSTNLQEKIKNVPSSHIFCCDEFDYRIHNSFPICSLVKQGDDIPKGLITRKSKKSMLFCGFSASGEILPPLCVCPSNDVITQLHLLFSSLSVHYCINSNLFFTKENIQEWFKTIFIPHLNQNKHPTYKGNAIVLLPEYYESIVDCTLPMIDFIFIPNVLCESFSPLEEIYNKMITDMILHGYFITENGITEYNQQYFLLKSLYSTFTPELVSNAFKKREFIETNNVITAKHSHEFLINLFNSTQQQLNLKTISLNKITPPTDKTNDPSKHENIPTNDNENIVINLGDIAKPFKIALCTILQSSQFMSIQSRLKQIRFLLDVFPLLSKYIFTDAFPIHEFLSNESLSKRPLENENTSTDTTPK